MDISTIIASDLDFYPLFDALIHTRVRTHLYYDPDTTSPELLDVADITTPITAGTLIGWVKQEFSGPLSTTVSEARPHLRHRAVMQRSGVGDGGLGGEVRRLCRAAGRRAGPRGPARAAASLHDGPPPARRARERRADGGQGRPVPRRGGAPVAAPLRRQGRLGRRDPAEGGARLRAPRDAGAGPGPGLAGGRHRPAEEGQALGRGGAAVLRPARQAGRLPGG